jgi:hypothetical protein
MAWAPHPAIYGRLWGAIARTNVFSYGLAAVLEGTSTTHPFTVVMGITSHVIVAPYRTQRMRPADLIDKVKNLSFETIAAADWQRWPIVADPGLDRGGNEQQERCFQESLHFFCYLSDCCLFNLWLCTSTRPSLVRLN